MKLEQLATISPAKLRAALPELLASHLTAAPAARACRAALDARVSLWSDRTASEVLATLIAAGNEPRLYAANASCRVASRDWASHVLLSPAIEGFENLERAMSQGPTVLMANHASYIDSPLLDALIALKDPALADRVVHIAGPKVYQAIFRRLASICLNMIPVQQSAAVRTSSPQGAAGDLTQTELARSIAQTLRASAAALLEGQPLLIYPEGSRTRNGKMGHFLPGTFRYLRVAGTRVVPTALEGTGEMMGLSGDAVTPGPCRVAFGEPIDVEQAGGPRCALAAAEARVRQLLPPKMRPLGAA